MWREGSGGRKEICWEREEARGWQKKTNIGAEGGGGYKLEYVNLMLFANIQLAWQLEPASQLPQPWDAAVNNPKTLTNMRQSDNFND